MRDLRNFRLREWLQLLPLQHGVKEVRNDVWQRHYCARRPAALTAFLDQQAHLEGSNIVLVVAFEQPWMLNWLIRMARRNVRDATVLVFDNSRRPQARSEIEQVCLETSTPYLALPANSTLHVNRSHGMAMTWIYRNVVRALEPRVFAFIDHDLIAVEPLEIAQRLGDQAMYGLPNQSPWGWHLWGGYCLYDYRQIAHAPLNFLHDFSRGLDTGGRNWRPLYRRHDPSGMRMADIHFLDVADPVSGSTFQLQVVDRSWLHIGGIGYNDNYRLKSELSHRIAQAFDDGATWDEIRASGTLGGSGSGQSPARAQPVFDAPKQP
jgi:hypothetical protein